MLGPLVKFHSTFIFLERRCNIEDGGEGDGMQECIALVMGTTGIHYVYRLGFTIPAQHSTFGPSRSCNVCRIVSGAAQYFQPSAKLHWVGALRPRRIPTQPLRPHKEQDSERVICMFAGPSLG